MMPVKRTTIALLPKHTNFLRINKINLSNFVQNSIDSFMGTTSKRRGRHGKG
jgi:hypothetical protein